MVIPQNQLVGNGADKVADSLRLYGAVGVKMISDDASVGPDADPSCRVESEMARVINPGLSF